MRRSCSTLIPAPAPLVFAVARDARSFRAAGLRIDRRGLLGDGDRVRLGRSGPVRVEVRAPEEIVLTGRRMRFEQVLIEGPAGTALVQRVYGRGVGERDLTLRTDWIRRRVSDAMPVVVGAAVIENGRLLAAQRSYPDALAGRYELPGGKVEPGETPRAALLREWQEELGVQIVPGSRVGADVLMGRQVLRVWRARIRRGVPEPHEHAQLRWVAADELAGLDWLQADRVLLPELRVLLHS